MIEINVPCFSDPHIGRTASSQTSQPVPGEVQSTPSQGITKTPTSFPDSRIAWKSYVSRFLLHAAFELHTQSRARHFLPHRPSHVALIILSSLQIVAGAPFKSARSADAYQSPEAPDHSDDPGTPQGTTTPLATDPATPISSTDNVPPDELPDPAESSPSGVDAIDDTEDPEPRKRS